MREIKFRAWDKEKKEMLYDPIEYELRCLGKPHHRSDESYRPIGFGASDHRYFDIMQFTGLHDVNGKEIYEGDILNVRYTSEQGNYNHDLVCSVYLSCASGIHLHFEKLLWVSCGWNQLPLSSELSFYYKHLSIDLVDGLDCLVIQKTRNTDSSNYVEIIGNIHENPELLEE